MSRLTILAAGAALTLTLPPPTLGAPASPNAGSAPRVHKVVIDKMKFGPLPADIRAGDTILWVNRDMFRHTVTARDKSFNIDLPTGKSGKTDVRRSGKIPFYCVYHPGMKGELAVAPR